MLLIAEQSYSQITQPPAADVVDQLVDPAVTLTWLTHFFCSMSKTVIKMIFY